MQRIAFGVLIVLVAGFTRCHWDRLTEPQSPPKLFDSNVYLEIAARPLDLDLLYYSKPPTVPLVFRAAGSDPAAIVAFQRELAFASWTALIAVIVVALRRRPARLAAVGFGVAAVLAATRVGWSGVLLSESLDDSLRVLITACAIGLAITARRDVRIACTVLLAGFGLAWLFTRDTNAIAAVVVVAFAAVVWPIRTWWATWRAGFAIAGLAIAAAVVSIASSRVVPEPLPFQDYWYVPLTSRASFPMINNVLARVLREDRAWLAEHGAPVDVLDRFLTADPRADKLVARTPELEPMQRWLIAHGDAVYLRWLVRHPIARSVELITAYRTVLAARHASRMPIGWIERDKAHLGLELFRRLTTNRWIILALIAASPLLLRRPRGHPLAAIAVCLIGSGVIAAAAAYYGDAVELARHCYGAGQQIVLGLWLALLAGIDRIPERGAWRWRRCAPVTSSP